MLNRKGWGGWAAPSWGRVCESPLKVSPPHIQLPLFHTSSSREGGGNKAQTTEVGRRRNQDSVVKGKKKCGGRKNSTTSPVTTTSQTGVVVGRTGRRRTVKPGARAARKHNNRSTKGIGRHDGG